MMSERIKSLLRPANSAVSKYLIMNGKKLMTSAKSAFNIAINSQLHPGIVKLSVKKGEKCYLLGNGPSIKDNLRDNMGLLKSSTLFVVNDMAKADCYATLKPKYYVFMDPCYYRKDLYKGFVDQAESTLEAIRNKTDWSMNIIIPTVAFCMGSFQKYFADNQNITIANFNTAQFEGFNKIKYYAYKKNMAMPYAQNVLVTCMYIAINMGFSEINILGADHSWTRDLSVSDNNEVYFIGNHFFDKNEKLIPVPQRQLSGEVYKMHQILKNYALMFEGYHSIRQYAELRNTNIFNRTPGSFIDAFERKNINAG